MGCPFAHLAAIASGSGAHHSDIVDKAPVAGKTLSQALRDGTAASHRQVEKSKGVGMLLHSVSSSRIDGEDALHFDRKDYVRWLVMLTSIYITLEAGLSRAQTPPTLAQGISTVPLLQPLLDSGLPALLARTQTLLFDIAAHLYTLEAHHGTSLEDIVQETRDNYFLESAEGIDREDAVARSDLVQLVLSLQPEALAITGAEPSSIGKVQLTEQHIDLLTPAQVHATRGYVRHLFSLVSVSSDQKLDRIGLVLSHAYTRYLGDLSGGQHILKKVAKKWPCDDSSALAEPLGDGFEFYRFQGDEVAPFSPTPQKGTNAAVARDLKQTFRESMDGGLDAFVLSTGLRDRALDGLVSEANISFEQNAALFEALLPAQHRMTNEEKALPTSTKIQADPHAHLASSHGKAPTLFAAAQQLLFAAPTKGPGSSTFGKVLVLTLASAVVFALSNQLKQQAAMPVAQSGNMTFAPV